MSMNFISTAAGAVAVAVMLAACSDESPQEQRDTGQRPVKLITIAGDSGESTARYPAVIDAGDSADLRFAIGGTILELPVTEAGRVAKGDLIARLDARDIRSSLASAEASFANAEDEYQRASRLAEQDAIAVSVLEQRKTQRDVAQSQLQSAQKAVADSEIRAPFDGVIASVPASAGSTLGPGEIVAKLIGLATLDATINLPASVIATAQTRANQGAFVILEAAPERRIEATFSEANLVADATSQTYSVTFTFQAPENMLVLPGMNATVVLTSSGSDAGAGAVAVPLAAVQSDGKGQYVWLVDPDQMTVSRRDVEVASGIGESVLINAGLATGDRIVGAGGAYLSDGMAVTPWTE